MSQFLLLVSFALLSLLLLRLLRLLRKLLLLKKHRLKKLPKKPKKLPKKPKKPKKRRKLKKNPPKLLLLLLPSNSALICNGKAAPSGAAFFVRNQLTNNIVTFSGTTATVTSAKGTQIFTTLPVGATTGPVIVNVSDHTATAATNFTVICSGRFPGENGEGVDPTSPVSGECRPAPF